MMPGKQYFTVTDGVTGLPTWLWRVIETKIIVGSAAMAAVTGVGVAVGCGRATASLDSSLGGDLPSNNADTGSPAASPRASLGPQTYQVPGYSVQPFVRALEHFTILPSPGSQDGEPFGEEPPGVWGSLDGHLPWKQHFANLLDSSRPARGLLHTEEVTGSIPVSPTQLSGQLRSCNWPFWILVQQQSAAAGSRSPNRATGRACRALPE
jgi:hypothetical protein